MLQDWEKGLVGNNLGTTARLPRGKNPARVVINRMRRWSGRRDLREELPSAA